MPPNPLTPTDAQAAADKIAALLKDAGVPESLARVSVHVDEREGGLHQTYVHVEAWFPGPGLVAETQRHEAEAQAAAEAAKPAEAPAEAPAQ
jgi:hypothetical protein